MSAAEAVRRFQISNGALHNMASDGRLPYKTEAIPGRSQKRRVFHVVDLEQRFEYRDPQKARQAHAAPVDDTAAGPPAILHGVDIKSWLDVLATSGFAEIRVTSEGVLFVP